MYLFFSPEDFYQFPPQSELALINNQQPKGLREGCPETHLAAISAGAHGKACPGLLNQWNTILDKFKFS